MAVEVWGQLNKAQDDPQTIAEAIAEAIAAHEADSEAHLGAGESLEAHRANDVLDHPQQSVVLDKLSSRVISYANSFAVSGSYDSSGSVVDVGSGYIRATANSSNPTSYLTSEVKILESLVFPTPNFLTEFSFSYTISGSLTKTSLLTVGDDYVGVGLIWNNTGVRAFVALDGSINYSSYLSISQSVVHVVRFFFNPETDQVDVYLNGELVSSLNVPVGTTAWSYLWQVVASGSSFVGSASFNLSLYYIGIFL